MMTALAVLPKVSVWDNPLMGESLLPAYTYEPHLNQRIRNLIPKGCGRAIVIVNGTALLQHEWHRPVLLGDDIHWHILPNGGQASRTILTIIAIIVISYFSAGIASGLGIGGAAGTAAVSIALNLVAQILINALIPIKPADGLNSNGVSPGSVYNTSLSGNQARLNQPIPVLYGRNKSYPDFACQPYTQYKNNDQYYYVLLCIGQGEYALEALLIDDTPIANFKSVYYRLLQPGQAPQQVKANIVSAVEVAGNTLDAGKSVGGFVVNKPLTQISSLSWDLVADQGIGVADPATGNFSTFTVEVDVDIQYVDDFGQPLADWTNLTRCRIRGASRTQQRRTYNMVLPSAGRVVARFTRFTAANDSNLVLNAISLTGLRGQLVAPAPLCATATYLEIAMKANEQLNGLTQKKLAVITRRKIKTWNPTTGWDAVNAESRSISWAIVDKLKNTVYGDRLDDGGIDLQTFYDLDQIYKARQDHLDILFDSRVTSKDANRTMAQPGRAIVFQRMGLFTITRDQYQAVPAASYTTRDIIPGSTSIGYALTTPETPDAINYEYFDLRSWDWVTYQAKLPGVTVPVNAVTLRVSGITGSFQAKREATYLANQALYRRKFPKWQTEMKGLLSAYGSAVVFAPALPGWGAPGDVVSYNAPGLTATLSEAPTWTAGVNHFITLEKPNGALTIAIPVTPGPTKFDVVLAIDPGFVPTTADADTERTKYVFGPEGKHRTIVRLTTVTGRGKSSEGNPIIEMGGVAENNLVHTADNPFLPAGGVIQDPVPTTTIDTASTGSDFGAGVQLRSHAPTAGNRFSTGAHDGGGGVTLKLNANGTASLDTSSTGLLYDSNTIDGGETLDGEWFSDIPEPGVTAQYEAYVTPVYDFALQATNFDQGPYGTWLNLGTNRSWRFGMSEVNPPAFTQSYNLASFAVKIRKVGSTVNLADTTIDMTVLYVGPSPGGDTDAGGAGDGAGDGGTASSGD